MSQSQKDSINDTRQTDSPDACIVGGDHVGRDVATKLVDKGVSVTLVDSMPPSDPPPELTVHHVTSLDATELRHMDVHEETTILAISPKDSANLLIAQLARTKFGVNRVIARVNDPQRVSAFEDLDIEAIDATAALSHVITERW
ncbi:TrkA-N domain-containing protein [Haladaptatus litoreus]|uniref:TrkA-N domain-containing protein n=1 Tax=Haladaptatus litoreus TaxID=553468 RepID=A0A1N7E8K2_9EURY|nr:NAD-binding protein [Haladaptatus litoreus]SIR84359.1 TrkA-N domain-containing protein [Haladaptatus litoreus]